MLIFFQPDTWTVISTLAGTISALASLTAVIVAAWTIIQARREHQGEIEAQHPWFVIADGEVRWVSELGGDHTITPFYKLVFSLQNVKPTPASHIIVKGQVLDNKLVPLCEFIRQPTDYIQQDGAYTVSENGLRISESPDPYVVKLYVTYRDSRTGKKQNQTLWRKFYKEVGSSDSSLELIMPDKSELHTFTDAAAKNLLEN